MSNGNIFISYRREDTAGHAGRVYDRLLARFPGRVFMDVTGITLGEDFVEEIERQVGSCEVLVGLIGKQWATITDLAGSRRLEQSEDFVRLELATALRRGITTIPVLVNRATMPDASTLPPDIASLTRRSALEITESNFDHDVDRLIQRLETVLAKTSDQPSRRARAVTSEKPTTVPTENPPLVAAGRPNPAPTERPNRRSPALKMGIGTVGLFVGAVALVFIIVFTKPKTSTVENAKVNSTIQNTNSAVLTAPILRPEANILEPPANAVQFVNSRGGLDGKLAEHYFDFSFYYPADWETDPKVGVPGASNFAKVERRLPPDYTQENFAVGWYTSRGTFAADESTFPQLVEVLGTNLARGFPGYRKVSEGPTKVNSLDAYEFRYVSVSKGSEKGDIQLWGRVIFVPSGVAGDPTGATLVMLATSLAPELSGVEDVGEKGQMPVILESFRFAKGR